MGGYVPLIPMLPLCGALAAGFLGRFIGRAGAHWATILLLAASCALSGMVAMEVFEEGPISGDWYRWAKVGEVDIAIGFLVDNLTAVMMLVVTSVSLLIHVYTIGYMADDPGYCRFFAYISLFTFSMLMLVMANNFLQLFFGWEAVGLVSYLLIGFWFKRESAVKANLKAFLVNRIGDMGFLIGIGLILAHYGSLHYAPVFEAVAADPGLTMEVAPGTEWLVATMVALTLFVGAMGKSAQFPLHVWLPDSMEGPTPISALIHAATMVTAGIFMVARTSPIFEQSETALAVVLAVGTVTAFFMGLVGLVQNDIKRVVAYSTLSQLGYMTAALGVSAYSVAIFHLMTHAFFKALLFLGAGSVIIALHHEQDMTRMGGMRRKMPVTYLTMLIGSLALCGLPPFSGFYSKDAIIESVRHGSSAFAPVAYWLLVAGAFVTALYSFRLIYLAFHGYPRMDDHAWSHAKESPPVVTAPLILLAIPSVAVGYFTMGPLVFGDFFDGAIKVLPSHGAVGEFAETVNSSAFEMTKHAVVSPAFYAALAGIALASVAYLVATGMPESAAAMTRPLHTLLVRKYWLDEFNEWFFARGLRKAGDVLYRFIDAAFIDRFFVNGTASTVRAGSALVRRLQTGYVYHYAFLMIACVTAFLAWALLA